MDRFKDWQKLCNYISYLACNDPLSHLLHIHILLISIKNWLYIPVQCFCCSYYLAVYVLCNCVHVFIGFYGCNCNLRVLQLLELCNCCCNCCVAIGCSIWPFNCWYIFWSVIVINGLAIRNFCQILP